MPVDDSVVAQSRADKSRQVRANYRQLRRDARNTVNDVQGSAGAKALCDKIAEANRLLEYVEKPREQAVDSELFLEFAEIGTQLASKLVAGSSSAMTPMEFIKKLRGKHVRGGFPPDCVEEDPSAFQWGKLGEGVSKYFSCVPGVSTMYGPLDTQPKERKAAQRTKKRPLGELVNPDDLDQEAMEGLEKQETDRNMEEIWKLLHKERPTPVLHIIMNHSSFAQTVENLFSLSFLVKDQRASLVKTPQGLGAVKRKAAEQSDFDSGRAENMQFIMALDMAVWRALREHVAPGQCLMKPRDGRHTHDDLQITQARSAS
mmetsp:Transcript_4317/g.12162  ORF Transcript_4317/g.12162 Transcript_4317/m.12162 type:complete len:316 (+) Transcript_4317:236-1183(+)